MIQHPIRWKPQGLILSGLILSSIGLLPMNPSFAQSVFNLLNGGSQIFGNEQVEAIASGGDVILNGTQVRSSLTAGGNVQANHCFVQGSLSAGGNALISDCESIHQINTGGNLSLTNTTIDNLASAGGNLALMNATIQGDANAGGDVQLSHSHIHGRLSTATAYLRLDDSSAGSIEVSPFGGFTAMNSGIVINGNNQGYTHSTIINGSRYGHALASISSGSISNINGYSIKATDNQTTVMTPDNSVYVNGKKVYGSGPKSYSAYQQQYPEAPNIQGPGWQEGSADTEDHQNGWHSPQQVIELSDHSVVEGNILFKGHHGKVIVQAGSRLGGHVIGGSVENQ